MSGCRRNAAQRRLQAAFAVGEECGLTVGLEAGVLMPWSTGSGGWLGWAPRPAPHHTTPISDRFFLGGTGEGTLRGFKLKGAGPTAPRRSPATKQVCMRGGALFSSCAWAGSSRCAETEKSGAL